MILNLCTYVLFLFTNDFVAFFFSPIAKEIAWRIFRNCAGTLSIKFGRAIMVTKSMNITSSFLFFSLLVVSIGYSCSTVYGLSFDPLCVTAIKTVPSANLGP